MASNLHKDLTDLQLHVPKGFASAATFTFLKGDIIVPLINSSGNGIINFTTSIRLEKT